MKCLELFYFWKRRASVFVSAIACIIFSVSSLSATVDISSVEVTSGEFVRGEEFTVEVDADNVDRGAVVFDYRPEFTKIYRFPLSFNGARWVATGRIPADFPLSSLNPTGPVNLNCIVTVFDKDGVRANRSVALQLKPDTKPPVVSLVSPLDLSFSSGDTTNVSGSVSPDAISLTVNGNAAAIGQNGEFIFNIGIVEGPNDITVSATDLSGNVGTSSVRITRDTTPPILSISEPIVPPGESLQVGGLNVMVRGKVVEANLKELMLGENNVTVDGEGNFEFNLSLATEGLNNVTVAATDRVAQKAIRVIPVVRDITGPTIAVTAPIDGFIQRKATTLVTGTVDVTADAVDINGVDAVINGGFFTANVPLVEGDNVLIATAADSLGNTATSQVTVTMDSIPPTIIVDSPVEGFATNLGSLSVSGSLDESGASLSVNGAPVSLGAGNTFESSIVLAEGGNTIVVSASDAAGNASTRMFNVTRDSIVPKVNIITPLDGLRTVNESILVEGTINDPTAQLTVNGISTENAGGTFSISVSLPAESGTLKITAVATDAVGNVGMAEINVIRDITAPVIAFLDPIENALLNDASLGVLGSIDDNTADVDVNGVPAVVGAGRFTVSGLSLTEGVNSITATATDPLGNLSDPVTVNVTLDSVAPLPPTIVNPPDIVGADRVALTGQTDANAFVDITGGLSPVRVQADEGGNFSFTALLVVNANNTLSIRATDPAGNKGAPLVLNILSDITPPVVSLSNPLPGSLSNQSLVLVSGRISDTNPGDSVKVQDSNFNVNADNTFSATVNLPNGNGQIIEVLATDAAGNETLHLVELDVQDNAQDEDPPLITVVSPVFDAIVSTTEIQVLANIIDESPITFVELNGVELSPLGNFLVGNILNVSVDVSETDQFTIRATDVNRESSEVTHRVQVDVDAPAPPVVNVINPGNLTNAESVTLYGDAEGSTILRVTGGLGPVEKRVGEDGKFTVVVPLNENATNDLLLNVTDEAGNVSDNTSVSIVQETVRPTIQLIDPANGAKQIPGDSIIEVLFDEPMDVKFLSGIELLVNNIPVGVITDLIDGGARLTIEPESDFPVGALVRVSIPATLADLAGNPLENEFVSQFTTIDDAAPDVPVLDPLVPRTNLDFIAVTGTAEAGSELTVAGGLELVTTTVGDNGLFSLNVFLKQNEVNNLSITSADDVGNSSPAVEVAVEHDSIPPTLVSTTPADGAINVSENEVVSLKFDEALDVANIGDIVLKHLLVVSTDNVLTASDTITLEPNAPLPGNTEFMVVIPTSLTDLAGNEFEAPVSFSFTTVDNNAPNTPVIHTSFPGSPTNLTEATIVGFSEPGSTVNIEGGASFVSFVTDTTGEFTVAVPLLPNSVNNITLRATDGENESAPTSVISIRQDSTAPQVINTVPAEGGLINVTEAVFVEFSEAMSPAPFGLAFPSIRVLDSTNQPIAGELVLSGSGKSLTFFPLRNLQAEEDFGLIIDTRSIDLAGNPIASTFTVNFKTGVSTSIELPEAPVVDPLPPPTTVDQSISLAGTAVPGSQLHVVGGAEPVAVSAGSDGAFVVHVPLLHDAVNNLLLYVTVDGVNGETATVSVTQLKREAGVRIFSPIDGREYNNRVLTVMGRIDYPENVINVTVDGEKAARFGEFFARQNLYEEEGEKTVTVVATLASGEEVVKTADFTLLFEPEGTDTRPPIVKIIYPENEEIINNAIVETMVTVEEGTLLSDVTIDNVISHNMVGNIFMIYAKLNHQGANDIRVEARDHAGLVGFDVVTVFRDDIAPATPIVDEVPSLTDKRIFPITGSADPGSFVVVEGGLAKVRVAVDEAGLFSAPVPLVPNESNRLTIYAEDEALNRSSTVILQIAHDDTPPRVVRTSPRNGEEGVFENTSISIDFSEALAEDSLIAGTSVMVVNSEGNEIDGNLQLSVDKKQLTFVPMFKMQRGDFITVSLSGDIADVNGFIMGEPYAFSFTTALHKTTISGVIVDPDLQPLAGVRVSIADTSIAQETSSFGTFLLDEVPVGDQILRVDARPNPLTGVSLDGDPRTFGYLEFLIPVVENTDNSLGRPIFLVPVDLSTTTRISGLAATRTFESATADLTDFSLSYEDSAARFGDGTTNGNITATRIDPPFIPDRLPDESIPHFLVEIGPDDLAFDPAASLTFPNVYELAEGEEVIVFHFKYGIHNYVELGRAAVGDNGIIETGPILRDSGFVGIVPANPSFDLSRTYLNGRVVGSNGDGLPGILVNAIAGNTVAITDENGEYSIPMPDVRLFLIRTYATVPTNLGSDEEGSPSLVFQSKLTELNPSGITKIPDIVVDTFFLGGSLRYIDLNGQKVPRTGLAYSDGRLVAVSDAVARSIRILVYRQIINSDGSLSYDTMPYARGTASLDPFEIGYDSGFSIPFLGSLNDDAGDEESSSNVPGPGDVVKIVAFDSQTGYYGEQDFTLPSLGAGEGGTSLDVLTMLDLRAPLLELDMNRVFFIDGIRRRANVPNDGLVLTDDEYVEIKTKWTTSVATPLSRKEIALRGRLRVDSIDFKNDFSFSVLGGEAARILEIREAVFPQRLSVLQEETDVGTETVSISRNGSFAEASLIPMTVRTDSFGLSTDVNPDNNIDVSSASFRVLDLEIAQLDDGTFVVNGRTTPEEELVIGGVPIRTELDGSFSSIIADVAEGGVGVQVGDSEETLVGASFVPVIHFLNPPEGSQGDVVIIDGEFFSPTANLNKVHFNGTPAQVVKSSENEIHAIVPDDASAGDVTVTVAGRVSNGVFFNFISEGINNGSFEHGTFKGFSFEGNAEVVKTVGSLIPTDRTFMAFLNTLDDPRDGSASLTSDLFFVPGGLDYLLFDFDFMGTAIFNDVRDYIDFYIVDGENEIAVTDVLSPDIPTMLYSVIGNFNVGTGFQTGALDVSAFAGGDSPIRVKIVLSGRGLLPQSIPGLRPDDDNPLDITKRRGTGLLLDNLRLASTNDLPVSIELEDLAVGPLGDGVRTLTGAAGSVSSDARVYVWGVQSGERVDVDAAGDGSFSIELPLVEGVNQTHFGISYSTKRTTTGILSDRKFSQSLTLAVENSE